MTVEEQMQLPHIEKVGNDEIEFRRLDDDDLLNWSNQVKATRRSQEEARLNADPVMKNAHEARQRLIQDIIFRDVEYSELWRSTFAPHGARKALTLSLKKGNKTDAEAVAILKRLHWSRLAPLAQIVMSPPEPEMMEGEQSGPPAESPGDGTGA